MERLVDWLKNCQFIKADLKSIYEIYFHRNPLQSTIYNPNYFYSPVSGIILYSKFVRKNEKILEIKGKNYTISEIMFSNDLPDIKYFVIGIFLTFYDVHYVKSPTNCFIKNIKKLPPIKSYNLPMIAVENSIIKEKLFPLKNKNNIFEYLLFNERHILHLTNYKLGDFYIVEIADKEVNCIVHFKETGQFVMQKELLSFIRFGSQVDIIIPLNDNINIKPKLNNKLIKEGVHIDFNDIIFEFDYD